MRLLVESRFTGVAWLTRTSSSVMRVLTSVPAPCEQLWITPFMSRYRLSMIGTVPASHEWFSIGYRSESHR